MRCTDDLRIWVHQAAKRCVIPEVGEHLSNQIRKEGFMGEAEFELKLEGVTFGMWPRLGLGNKGDRMTRRRNMSTNNRHKKWRSRHRKPRILENAGAWQGAAKRKVERKALCQGHKAFGVKARSLRVCRQRTTV